MSDSIKRQAVIDTVRKIILGFFSEKDGVMNDTEKTLLSVSKAICNGVSELPSAQPDYLEVLGWLLAYHTQSFDLHGRYLPHEVISWLINDFTKEFIAERRTDDTD